MYGIQFAEQVATDLVEQYQFLDGRQSGLGELFLDDIQSMFEILKGNPHMFQKRFNEYRIALTKRYRYKVIYRIKGDDTVQVVAVRHPRQHPAGWIFR
ncbi:MAG: type II toxin-antitoxin system RelE/ParE family toxin [Spirochaetaceae bacterium]|nr:MAG: type II toxin-antitoxin system RelE/ParE family toxin [Spirochaetaceae bacterium]